MKAEFEVSGADAVELYKAADVQAREFAGDLPYAIKGIASYKRIITADGRIIRWFADVTIEVATQ